MTTKLKRKSQCCKSIFWSRRQDGQDMFGETSTWRSRMTSPIKSNDGTTLKEDPHP